MLEYASHIAYINFQSLPLMDHMLLQVRVDKDTERAARWQSANHQPFTVSVSTCLAVPLHLQPVMLPKRNCKNTLHHFHSSLEHSPTYKIYHTASRLWGLDPDTTKGQTHCWIILVYGHGPSNKVHCLML